MLAIDSKIDEEPTFDNISNLIELQIRNKLCFAELESFNTTGKWLMKHPILAHRKEYERLKDLRHNNPERFLSEMSLARQYVKRYRSQINTEKGDKQKNEENLHYYSELITIGSDLIETNNYGPR